MRLAKRVDCKYLIGQFEIRRGTYSCTMGLFSGTYRLVLANMRLQRKQGSSQNNLKVQLLHTPAQSQVRLETFIANNGFLSSTFAQALICRALTGLSIVCSRLQDKKDAKNARGLGERDGALSPILSRNLPFTGFLASYSHLACFFFAKFLLSESLTQARFPRV